MNPADYLTPAQYAKAKGISQQTAYAHLKSGQVKPVTIAGRLFINASVLN